MARGPSKWKLVPLMGGRGVPRTKAMEVEAANVRVCMRKREAEAAQCSRSPAVASSAEAGGVGPACDTRKGSLFSVVAGRRQEAGVTGMSSVRGSHGPAGGGSVGRESACGVREPLAFSEKMPVVGIWAARLVSVAGRRSHVAVGVVQQVQWGRFRWGRRASGWQLARRRTVMG
jgi:hypothetical protein